MKKKTKTSFDSNIYIKAAKLIQSHEWLSSCTAVDMAANRGWSFANDLYVETMAPEGYDRISVFNIIKAIEIDSFTVMPSGWWIEKCSDFRIWLLCMMAACCKDMK